MNQFIHRIFVSVILFFTSCIIYSQHGENPSNKYLSSYKKYVNATCPVKKNNIKHFVYFARDRKEIKEHPFLSHNAFQGAQIMYSWKELEPTKGEYDFSVIEKDIRYLQQFDKKLFIQLQDATFSVKHNPLPQYLRTKEYNNGAVQHIESKKPIGWIAKRWNKRVQQRFALLLKELGTHFDGRIEGINLQETSINVKGMNNSGFSEGKYVEGLKANMFALKKSFPTSVTMIYANFIPGEWLPWEDKGYLKGIYTYGETIGVGMGAPDLMVTRKGQLNHALAQMHENTFSVPIGIAVQEGNYIGKTGADTDYNESKDRGMLRENIVPMLAAFGKDFLKVDYMFWTNQEPYFEEDVLSCFE